MLAWQPVIVRPPLVHFLPRLFHRTAGVVRRVGEGDQITGGVLLQGRAIRPASTGRQEQDPR